MPTARPSNVASFEWAAESAFAESTSTTSTRMILRQDGIDVSGLQRPLVNRGGLFQRMNEGDNDVPGAFGVSTFSTTFDLYGHGSATTGALTATNLVTLLGHAIGNKDVSQVGGLLTTGTNDVDTLTSTNTTLLQGGLLRVGTLGDGRAEGQLTVASGATSPYELDVALPDAPTTSDSVRAMQLVYPVSDASNSDIVSSGAAANNTLRIRLQTANYQFLCRGCVAQSIEFTGLAAGEMPQVSITWAVAHWEHVADTFPDTTATSDYAPAPVANGSFFYQAKGTVTRSVLTPRNFSLSIGHAVQPIMGPGGSNSGQDVIGWVRTAAPTTLTFAVEAEAATAAPTYHDYFVTDPNSITNKHIAYLLNPTDGRSVGFYFPNCKPIGSAPTQTAVDGLNYVELSFEALTNTDTTNELTLSHYRLGLG